MEQLKEAEFKPWMTKRKFIQKDEEYEIIGGGTMFVSGDFRNIVRFKNTKTEQVFVLTDEMFFDKVSLI